MIEEQNTTGNGSETGDAGDNSSAATNSTVQSQSVAGSDTGAPQDDYYAVDDPKKEVLSTIGDGEMRDEGLAGAGEIPTDIQTGQDQLSDEQDVAEAQDSEG